MISQGEKGKMQIKHKIWIERNGRVIFGHGRRALLRAIDECGSLNSAAKRLNMSYRAAWGRLKASEERLGIKLTEVDASSGKMRMTDDAKDLLRKFEELEKETEAFVEFAYQKLAFPLRQEKR
jgi:molybdate transport system regulatory protein